MMSAAARRRPSALGLGAVTIYRTPTAAGLVFTGDLNGDVLALDAVSGSVLWRDSTGAAIGGGVISYRSGGHQRIAVAAGMNSRLWPVKKNTARIVIYGLQ